MGAGDKVAVALSEFVESGGAAADELMEAVVTEHGHQLVGVADRYR
jgi:hypothetical protein